MPIINIELTFNSINASVQVGDNVYYTTGGGPNGGFNEADLLNTILLGEIIVVTDTTIIVAYDNTIVNPPPQGSYISFAKNKKINTSSLLGYYALVNLHNNAKGKVELFSIGSEITESSK